MLTVTGTMEETITVSRLWLKMCVLRALVAHVSLYSEAFATSTAALTIWVVKCEFRGQVSLHVIHRCSNHMEKCFRINK